MPSGELKPLVFFVGPTATGKSSLGLQWAMEHQSIILNGDSLQVYREVNIGTAKPTQQERDRVPHRLFDFVLPPEEFTAGKYSQMARAEIKKEEDVSSYVLVGGSGFYIQAFEKAH